MTGLANLDAAARAWIPRHARVAPSWSESALRAALASDAAAFDALIHWERALHTLAQGASDRSGRYVLALGERAFGALAAMTDGPAPAPIVSRAEDGRPIALAGRTPRGRLGMDTEGRLYIGEPGQWRPIAGDAATYLARLACMGERTASTPLHLALDQRHAEVVATRLGLPEAPALGDDLQRWWRSDTIVLHERDLEAPDEDSAHLLAVPAEAPRLIEACRDVGAAGALVGSATARIEAPRPAPDLPRPLLSMPHRPRRGRGDGWIALLPDLHRLEEVCFVDGQLIREAVWPEGPVVEYTRAVLDGLSAAAQSRLDRHGFRRDLRRTCDRADPAGWLARAGLPANPTAIAIETRFGGLRCPFREGASWFALGTCEVLLQDRETGDHTLWAADSDVLQGSDWPRVIWQDELLVPVGSAPDATLYATPSGVLVEHAWMHDDVAVVGHDPAVLLERYLLRLDTGSLEQEGKLARVTAPERRGDAVALALALPPLPAASDAIARWWVDDAGTRYVVEDDHGTTVMCADASTLAKARAVLAAGT
ncbi:hypothetical protein [Chondromyces apiculatus]|uniref:Uncharacterized protein n=1 Tax=Chondromyces apiculatus DSM 436 TaxID=1192034 RepID=A0A017STB1_9BACT|nr:hypothetical protein [Chondromyces apiculatus]EYF00233.1 Hypothetical protein CAP_1047 [Chondromyces apiculatus DSM 436]